MTQVKQAERKLKRSWWPLIGFLLVVSLGVISYFLAPNVIDLTLRALPRLSLRGISPEVTRWIFTALTFGILVILVGLFVALFAPRKRTLVNETDLVKEREEMLREQQRTRARQRNVNIEVRKQLRDVDPRSGKGE
jgi:hypothetical protein